jgi:ribonuclease H2 subunit C
VLHVTDKQVPQAQSKAQPPRDDEDEEGEDEDEDMEVVQIGIAEQVGEFDEVIVWGHGGQVDEAQDGLVRGVREWIGWAESMHIDEEEDAQQDQKSTKKE